MRIPTSILCFSMIVAALGGALRADAQARTDNDQDGDGVPDEADLCPKVAGASSGIYADGCPLTDADRDGIADDYDLCPNEAETVNGFEDQDGCPDVAAAELSAIGQKVYFETAKASLDATGKSAVSDVAAFLRAHAEIVHVNVVGYADARGAASDNAVLSMRRAETVRAALIAAGLAAGRLDVRGGGAQPGEAPEILAANRRAEFAVTEIAGRRRTAVATAAIAPFVGCWSAGGAVEVEVDDGGGSVRAKILPGAPSWLGPAGSLARAYGVKVTAGRMVAHVRGAVQSFSLVLMREGPRVRGVVAAGTAGAAAPKRMVVTAAFVAREQQMAPMPVPADSASETKVAASTAAPPPQQPDEAGNADGDDPAKVMQRADKLAKAGAYAEAIAVLDQGKKQFPWSAAIPLKIKQVQAKFDAHKADADRAGDRSTPAAAGDTGNAGNAKASFEAATPPPQARVPGLTVGQTWRSDGIALTLAGVEFGTMEINTHFFIVNDRPTPVTLEVGADQGLFALSDNKGRAWPPSQMPDGHILLQPGQKTADIGPRFNGQLLADTGVSELLLAVEGIVPSKRAVWRIPINTPPVPSAGDTVADSILPVGQTWQHGGRLLQLGGIDLDANQINTHFVLANRSPSALVFEPHWSAGHFQLQDNLGRIWPVAREDDERVALNPGQQTNDIGPRFHSKWLTDMRVRQLTFSVKGLAGVPLARWTVAVNTPPETPQRPDTPPGTVLAVGQPWRWSDLVFRLGAAQVDESRVNLHFFVANQSQSPFAFATGAGLGQFELIDNKGRPWKVSDADDDRTVLRPGATSSDIGPQFDASFLADEEVTHLILTVKGLCGLPQAKWRIDIVR